jgi:hypothetical protein
MTESAFWGPAGLFTKLAFSIGQRSEDYGAKSVFSD